MTVEVIGFVLMDKILEMAFFVFFIMLLFSNIITSFSTFYNDRELNFLFALPVRPTSIYLAKLLENCLYASWATMVIALPLVCAYGITTKAPFVFFPISILSIIMYLVIPAALASMLIFLMLRLFPRLKSRDVILLSVMFVVGLTFLYIKIQNPALLKIFETENEQELLEFAAHLTTVGGIYVPSTWLSNILKGLRGNTAQGMFYFLVFLFTSVSTTIVAFFAAKILYAKSWLSIGEHVAKKGSRRSLLSSYPDVCSRTNAVGAAINIYNSFGHLCILTQANAHLFYLSLVANDRIVRQFCLCQFCLGDVRCAIHIPHNESGAFWYLDDCFVTAVVSKNPQGQISFQFFYHDNHHRGISHFFKCCYTNGPANVRGNVSHCRTRCCLAGFN
jgi:hypothetical protein